MTKLEITNLITKHLTSSPILLYDLLDKSIKIDSFEKYVQEFTLAKEVFKDDIPEFYNEANLYLEKMNKFVTTCETSQNVTNYINSYLKSQLCGSGNTSLRPKFVSPNNLSASAESTEQALKLIYHELGEADLLLYIQLLKSPTSLSSYLNDSKKQKVAMHYILFATNHHSTTKLSRNLSAQNVFKLTNSSINDSIQEITSAKNDYISLMNAEKAKYSSWFSKSSEQFNEFHSNSQETFQDFLADCNSKLSALEKTYSEKLKVEAPSDFMKTKSEEYKKQSHHWAWATAGLSIVLILLLGLILDPHIEVSNAVFTIHLFSGEMPVYNSIIIFAIIALIIYVLKLFIKMTISAKHLSEEYHQKHVLTYFYLSLVKDNNISQEQANIILATLFSKADTGLIKNDTSNEIESIYKLILSTKA